MKRPLLNVAAATRWPCPRIDNNVQALNVNENVLSTDYLLMQELQRQLQPHRLHVGFLQGGGDVHVHVEEALHSSALLRLLDLQLGQQGDEPFEGALLPVQPVSHHPEKQGCGGAAAGGASSKT